MLGIGCVSRTLEDSRTQATYVPRSFISRRSVPLLTECLERGHVPGLADADLVFEDAGVVADVLLGDGADDERGAVDGGALVAVAAVAPRRQELAVAVP